MKNKIMTPEEWLEPKLTTRIANNPIAKAGILKTEMGEEKYIEKTLHGVQHLHRNNGLYKDMQAYAHYYAKALIESLTDDEINKANTGFLNMPLTQVIQGAEWAREELLKMNEL